MKIVVQRGAFFFLDIFTAFYLKLQVSVKMC